MRLRCQRIADAPTTDAWPLRTGGCAPETRSLVQRLSADTRLSRIGQAAAVRTVVRCLGLRVLLGRLVHGKAEPPGEPRLRPARACS